MCGPFPFPPLADLVVSPLGLVPKKEPVKLYLIHHLSFPKGGSANDAIDLDACSISYTSFDVMICWFWNYGQGALMAKTDVEAAFRLLPVHLDSFYLLGCHWRVAFYVDRCLPMGCSISCSLFETRPSVHLWSGWCGTGRASIPSSITLTIFYAWALLFSGCAGFCWLLCSISQNALEYCLRPVVELSFLGNSHKVRDDEVSPAGG